MKKNRSTTYDSLTSYYNRIGDRFHDIGKWDQYHEEEDSSQSQSHSHSHSHSNHHHHQNIKLKKIHQHNKDYPL